MTGEAWAFLGGISVALITAGGSVLASWLQNRKTRGRVEDVRHQLEPMSNGFAPGVSASLVRLHEKLDRFDGQLADHLADHRAHRRECVECDS